MVTFNDTPSNVAYLAALFGFELPVARSWLRLEGQSIPNPTNPLNIRNSLEMTGQITTSTGQYAYFEDAQRGLWSAKQVVTRNRASFGYQAILDAGWTRDPFRQAQAIEASSWAAGHYGSDWANGKPGAITDYLKGLSVISIALPSGIQYSELITVPANVEIVDGIGRVVEKTAAAVADVPTLGENEDGWQSIAWKGSVRFIRTPQTPTVVDPCTDEAKLATEQLNQRIDAAQAQA